MPELPEVETIRIGLDKLIPGQVITDVTFDWSKSFPNAKSDVNKFLIGAKIVSVARRAKVLVIELSTKYTVLIHLKMTGQLVYRGEQNFGAGHPNDSLIGQLPDKSTRVIFYLKPKSVKGRTFHKAAGHSGPVLYFNDQRKFGWVRLVPTIEVPNVDFMKKLGPEPLSADFTSQDFKRRLQRRPNTSIKAALLDQSVVAGIGNIYADESLWGAKIHPSTLVKNLSSQKMAKLFDELQYVLSLSIEKGGSSDRNYVNAEGKKGSYIEFARVFRRENLPCPRCGTTIIKIRVAGRGTHICPTCQRQKS